MGDKAAAALAGGDERGPAAKADASTKRRRPLTRPVWGDGSAHASPSPASSGYVKKPSPERSSTGHDSDGAEAGGRAPEPAPRWRRRLIRPTVGDSSRHASAPPSADSIKKPSPERGSAHAPPTPAAQVTDRPEASQAAKKRPSWAEDASRGCSAVSEGRKAGAEANTQGLRPTTKKAPPRAVAVAGSTSCSSQQDATKVPPKRRRLIRPVMQEQDKQEGRVVEISTGQEAVEIISSLKKGEDLKVTISRNMPLSEVSNVVRSMYPVLPAFLAESEWELLFNKLREEAAAQARIDLNKRLLDFLQKVGQDVDKAVHKDSSLLQGPEGAQN